MKKKNEKHQLCFRFGRKVYLINLMQTGIKEGSTQDRFMKMIDREIQRAKA